MASGTVDQVVQLLGESIECQICLKTVEDPRLCPQCSKLFCDSCIRQWMQRVDSEHGNTACPNCACPSRLEDFVKFRSGSAIAACKAIVDGYDNGGDGTGSAREPHQSVGAEKIQQRLRKMLLEAEATFIETDQRITQELEKQRTLLKQCKDNLIKTINIMVQQELKDIHQQFNAKTAEVNAWAEILGKTLDKHQFTLLATKQTLEAAPAEDLVQKQPELEKTCAKLSDDLKAISPNVKPHRFNSHLIPEPSSWRFSVRKYSAIGRTNEIQYSDLVTDDIGSVWRLEVHPNGYDDAKNTSLSIFLQLYEGIEGRYHYSVELLGPTRNHRYEDESYFELRKGWGQNHFIDLKSLQESFLVDDGFELVFSVRSLNLIDKYEKVKKKATLLATEVEQLKKEARPDCLNQVVSVRNVVEATKASSCLYSEVLNDDLGGSWRLHVYPGGTDECRGTFLGVFLELCSGISNKYEFSVSLLHRTDKKVVKKTLDFCFLPTQPFGWKTFLGREDFINGGYIQKDSLSLRITVKPPNALQKFNYLRQYHERALANVQQQLSRQDAPVGEGPRPTTSQEPFEARLRKTSISFVKNLFTKSSSQDQP
ncbi:E3 ubiquitin-protein ligase TRIM37-like [Anopheles cruzii]|uniref:E3 ubiquitin-protein ligase TRIM37-like n=1 Tax=Anopheles cruzii TaxID=68878 RepID=UPI0022EC4F89|nr:E3 ubiquitin-protein ligase TRIM37-like [Anopheles cruzii]